MYYKQFVAVIVLAVATMLAAVPTSAMEPGQYASGAGAKLGRGVVNTVTGWGEIPMQTVIGSKTDGFPGGVGGFFKGIGLGVARTLAGAFEIATFWAPVPERFEPVMEPATVFDMTTTSSAFAKTGTRSPSR
jgi:putative exosortase-associated protein (TIGR04073 family)